MLRDHGGSRWPRRRPVEHAIDTKTLAGVAVFVGIRAWVPPRTDFLGHESTISEQALDHGFEGVEISRTQSHVPDHTRAVDDDQHR